MKQLKLTPTNLRTVLIIGLFFLVSLSVVVFFYGRGIISEQAKSAQSTSLEAQKISSDASYLQKMEAELKRLAPTIQKTAQLVSESKQYVYQDRIISDINRYANDAGLSVVNITFSEVVATTPGATGTTEAPATDGTASTTTSTATPSAPANIKSRIANVTLDNPTDYNKVMAFLHSIEESVFRMRINSIGLSRLPETGGLNTDVLEIEVFVR